MSRVCVTGATGYIASWLVKKLLDRGCTVHGTVRNLGDEKKTEVLRGLPGAAERLVLFEADIYDAASFEPAIQGCEFVFLVATPLRHNSGSSKGGEGDPKMNPEDGTSPWFLGQPQAPPWNVLDYSELISSGPLLPLLQEYANIGYGNTSALPRDPWQATPPGTTLNADAGRQFQLMQMANQGIPSQVASLAAIGSAERGHQYEEVHFPTQGASSSARQQLAFTDLPSTSMTGEKNKIKKLLACSGSCKNC